MAEDKMLECRLFGKLIPEGLCVEILIAPGLADEAAHFTKEQIQAACDGCPYSAD